MRVFLRAPACFRWEAVFCCTAGREFGFLRALVKLACTLSFALIQAGALALRAHGQIGLDTVFYAQAGSSVGLCAHTRFFGPMLPFDTNRDA